MRACGLSRLPSLDLYARPRAWGGFPAFPTREIRGPLDVYEYFAHISGDFPEPYTFGERLAQFMRPRLRDYDLVHDNQTLSRGLLKLQRAGLPVVGTIHHPITMDRRIAIDAAESFGLRLLTARWYGFLRMQKAVARKLAAITVCSQSTRRDAARDFRLDPARLNLVPLGVDTELFRPMPGVTRGRRSPDRDGERGRALEGSHLSDRGLCPAAGEAPEPQAEGHRAPARWADQEAPSGARHPGARHVRLWSFARGAGARLCRRRDPRLTVRLRRIWLPGRRGDGLRHPRSSRPTAARSPRSSAMPASSCRQRIRRRLPGRLPRSSTIPGGAARSLSAGASGCCATSCGSAPRRARSTSICASCARRMLTVDLKSLDLKDGQRLLDLGCGAGRHLHNAYYAAKIEAFGLDRSLPDVEKTRDGFYAYPDFSPGAECRYRLAVGDCLGLPFADASFDTIICSEVLEHIPGLSARARRDRAHAETRRAPRRQRAALLAGMDLLATRGGLSHGARRPCADLQAGRAAKRHRGRRLSLRAPPFLRMACIRPIGGCSVSSGRGARATLWSRRITGFWSGTS